MPICNMAKLTISSKRSQRVPKGKNSRQGPTISSSKDSICGQSSGAS